MRYRSAFVRPAGEDVPPFEAGACKRVRLSFWPAGANLLTAVVVFTIG
jgi:hypothetical protein